MSLIKWIIAISLLLTHSITTIGYDLKEQPPEMDEYYSTTGPTPSPNVLLENEQKTSIRPEAHIVTGVPAYVWRHGCGPTAVGMVVGYWDGQGFENLVEGPANITQYANVDSPINEMIASSQGVQSHYSDYSLPLDYGWPVSQDRSELPAGDEHASNSVADFMRTSFSVDDIPYGGSWSSNVISGFKDYVNYINQQAGRFDKPSGASYYVGSSSAQLKNLWDALVAEVDENRPMVFLLDSNGDGYTDHFITAIGYDVIDGQSYFIMYNTWDREMHQAAFNQISNGVPWGIAIGYSFNIEHGVDPNTLTEKGYLPLITR